MLGRGNGARARPLERLLRRGETVPVRLREQRPAAEQRRHQSGRPELWVPTGGRDTAAAAGVGDRLPAMEPHGRVSGRARGGGGGGSTQVQHRFDTGSGQVGV